MPRGAVGRVFAWGLIASVVCAATQAAEAFRIERGFDGQAFEARMEPMGRGQGYTIQRITYPSPVVTPFEANNTVPVDYYLPQGLVPGAPRRPAVICLHILNGNFELERMICSLLASRGVPALMMKLPYYGERGLPGGREALLGDARLFIQALPQGLADARRAVDVLAQRPEVDPERIGVLGISMGGILAASTAGADPRLYRTALILAGGDLERIIGAAKETRELRAFLDGQSGDARREVQAALDAVEPLHHAAGLRGRAEAGRVLMVNADADEVIPPECSRRLAEALGMAERVEWLSGLGHYTAVAALPRVFETTVAFFAQDLPPGAGPAIAAADGRAPLQAVQELVRQVSAFANTAPASGQCHLADLAVTVKTAEGKSYEGWLRLFRAAEGRFRLEANLPKVGRVMLGQGDYPWMASTENRVFRGVLGEPSDIDTLVGPEQRLRLEGLRGALGGVALMPAALEQLIDAKDVTANGGPRVLEIGLRGKDQGRARLIHTADGQLAAISVAAKGLDVRIDIRGWQLGAVAPAGLFTPPADMETQDVAQRDLQRMLAAMFNFLMESLQ